LYPDGSQTLNQNPSSPHIIKPPSVAEISGSAIFRHRKKCLRYWFLGIWWVTSAWKQSTIAQIVMTPAESA
jgi:hypothetical protein